MSVHIRTRGLVAYFRRRIPDDLKSRFGRSEIIRSLGPGSAFEAEASARLHWMATEACFKLARMDKRLSREDLNRLIDHYVAEVKAGLARTGTAGKRDGSSESLHEDAGFFRSMAGNILAASNQSQHVIDRQALTELGKAVGLELPPQSTAEAQAQDALARALAKVFTERAQQTRNDLAFIAPGLIQRFLMSIGLSAGTLPDTFSSLAPAEAPMVGSHAPAQPQSIVLPPTVLMHAVAPAPPTSAPTTVASEPPAPLFSELWPKLVEDKIKFNREWAQSRASELKSTANLVTWIVGDKPLNAYSRQTFAEFFATYAQLPSTTKTIRQRQDYRASVRRSGDTPQAVINYAEIECRRKNMPFPRIDNKSSNKHLSNLRALFGWAKTNGILSEAFPDILSGFDKTKKQRGKHGRDERQPYSSRQIKAMFDHPVWTGQKSDRFYNESGDVIVMDALYWAPLMAAFHGMRREEICQLRVRHIKQQSGIWFVNLKAPDLVLKVPNDNDDSGGSARHVPLHREFLRIGFIKEVILGRSPDELLFPELSNDNASSSYGLKFGKRFLRVQRSLEVFNKNEQLGVHRFRHFLITQLEDREDVKDAWIEELCGHSSDDRQSEFRRYSKAKTLVKLKQVVDLVVLPIDVDKLIKARERCAVSRLPATERPDNDEE